MGASAFGTNGRTEALAGFKDGKYPVLVVTDIAARGIDVEALGHVVNFDVPVVPEDYIHRVGRTARAELTGEAFTLVSPGEQGDLARIERAINKRLPRVTVPDFDCDAKPKATSEVSRTETHRGDSRARRMSVRGRVRTQTAGRRAVVAAAAVERVSAEAVAEAEGRLLRDWVERMLVVVAAVVARELRAGGRCRGGERRCAGSAVARAAPCDRSFTPEFIRDRVDGALARRDLPMES